MMTHSCGWNLRRLRHLRNNDVAYFICLFWITVILWSCLQSRACERVVSGEISAERSTHRKRKCSENYTKWHDKFIFFKLQSAFCWLQTITVSECCLIKLLPYILFEKCLYILTIEMAGTLCQLYRHTFVPYFAPAPRPPAARSAPAHRML